MQRRQEDEPYASGTTLPLNDTPRNLMLRFRDVCQQRKATEYPGLFATNFRFRFSAAMDPELVTEYGDNWDLSEEAQYADHLFKGFRDSSQAYQPAASRITLSLDPFPIDDPARPDSVAHYKSLVVPSLHLEVEVTTSPKATVYQIDGRYQFWMVRGEAAALGPGQPADSLHWYIYRWDDQSTPADALAKPPPLVSWGRLKAVYL
jgi:hypothetical protein